jgi:hypothetical protein
MNNTKKILFILAALVPAAAAAGPMMQPGLWEITTKMEMPGMPVAVPPTRVSHCYTPQDVENTGKTLPKDQNCKVDSHSVAGNRVTWAVSCQDKNSAMTGNGEMTYKGNSYEGTMKMSVKSRGEAPMNMTYRYSGKRLGECKK